MPVNLPYKMSIALKSIFSSSSRLLLPGLCRGGSVFGATTGGGLPRPPRIPFDQPAQPERVQPRYSGASGGSERDVSSFFDTQPTLSNPLLLVDARQTISTEKAALPAWRSIVLLQLEAAQLTTLLFSDG